MASVANQRWLLMGFSGFDSIALKSGPPPIVGPKQVLVRWKYASLNYRDLVISKASATICSAALLC
jgi:NADPH:quinone reductase-like Zn-dependent oxidoreductase